ncbi:GT2 family glycosyltransferase [Roseimicrobium gellanilyticum]|uniref:GT2 family glycosyltransferase n=1 Tax=Roseimicrobium gellanilyticum TaxID=748857 RepID=A0A366HPL1_9BACT|nr:glycosyltransferase family 2 protein [Roseimicrobium gellanilyticum]RBP45301.1 GT2 family glycosyltransferase [Roseimicrobium gellanilyticum]
MNSAAFSHRDPPGFVMGTAASGHTFAFSVTPAREESAGVLARRAKLREVDLCVTVLSDSCNLQGWFVPPRDTEIFGIRAVHGQSILVAKRKQFRPEALMQHPGRPEALYSGFSIELKLQSGWTRFELQYKSEQRKWVPFAKCDVRLPWAWRLMKRFVRRAAANSYERWLRSHGDPDAMELEAMRNALGRMPGQPLLSVLMPVYDSPERWLLRAIQSVQHQVYPNWELCIADDCSPSPQTREFLQKQAALDPRIKLCLRSENGHICKASNSALELCTGEFTVLLDHDDELPPHALFHIAWEAAHHPEAGIIFSDEDKIDASGVRTGPYFKPGWNYDLLLGQNCVSHLGSFRTSLLREVGGFRPGYEGSQDWDITLRALTHCGRDKVRHIPRVLYHWRTLPTSTASTNDAKPYAASAGYRAVEDHLRVTGTGAVLQPLDGGKWQVIWPLPDPPPRVSIIIPTRDRHALLRDAMESHASITEYPDVELIVVDNDSTCVETLGYLRKLEAAGLNAKVIRHTGAFNWSALNNLGASVATGSVLVFLNNDVRITNPDWLCELVRQACRKEVGAVGARLLYERGLIQHAGVVLSMVGIAGHVFRNSPPDAPSIGGPPDLVREVSAVTGACLAVRRDVFERAGRFDEVTFPIAYNDVEFCLRLRDMGLTNIYTPFATLVHHESQSRRTLEATSERKAAIALEAHELMRRWPLLVHRDPCYNINLSLDAELPIMARPRREWPWLQAQGPCTAFQSQSPSRSL